MFLKVDRELLVMIGFSVCTMLVCSTENTLQNMQEKAIPFPLNAACNRPFLESNRLKWVEQEPRVEGYTVSGIKIALSCVILWVSPYANYALGPRFTLSLSSLGIMLQTISFITESPWVVYSGAVVVGMADAAFWPAEGRYLIENSSPQNLNRNMAITAFAIKAAFVLGNLLVYYSFYGLKYVNRSSRNVALYCLAALQALGVVAYLILPRSKVQVKENFGVWRTMKKSWQMLMSPQMLWLCLSLLYNGLQVTFWQGVYSPSLGFTLAFGDSVKELVGLSGIFMSFGGVIGCILPLVFSDWLRSYCHARFLLVLIGAVAQLIGYIIAMLILPHDAVYGNTNNQGPFPPNIPIAMLGSTLLCFGDAFLFIETIAILGDMYPDHGAEAISLYKFVMNITGAASFFYSNHISMFVNAGICAVMAVFNVLGFYMADRWNMCHRENTPNSPEKPLPSVAKEALPWEKSRGDKIMQDDKTPHSKLK